MISFIFERTKETSNVIYSSHLAMSKVVIISAQYRLTRAYQHTRFRENACNESTLGAGESKNVVFFDYKRSYTLRQTLAVTDGSRGVMIET